MQLKLVLVLVPHGEFLKKRTVLDECREQVVDFVAAVLGTADHLQPLELQRVGEVLDYPERVSVDVQDELGDGVKGGEEVGGKLLRAVVVDIDAVKVRTDFQVEPFVVAST
uniref:(northern house mosquito) hypothetical protein n=1 Tax=Culex pipiens TaxID=7175 RepID=A0A8D8BUG5_CULPI